MSKEIQAAQGPASESAHYQLNGGQSTLKGMSDTESAPTGPTEPSLAEVIAQAEPIGDLSRFVIEDLTEEEEDQFFGILQHGEVELRLLVEHGCAESNQALDLRGAM